MPKYELINLVTCGVCVYLFRVYVASLLMIVYQDNLEYATE